MHIPVKIWESVWMFDIFIFHVLVVDDVLELALCWNLDSLSISFPL